MSGDFVRSAAVRAGVAYKTQICRGVKIRRSQGHGVNLVQACDGTTLFTAALELYTSLHDAHVEQWHQLGPRKSR